MWIVLLISVTGLLVLKWKFTGNVPLSATSHSIALGLINTKILGIQCLVESSASGIRYLPNSATQAHYEVSLDQTNIVVQVIETNLDGEPFVILITD